MREIPAPQESMAPRRPRSPLYARMAANTLLSSITGCPGRPSQTGTVIAPGSAFILRMVPADTIGMSAGNKSTLSTFFCIYLSPRHTESNIWDFS